MRAFRLFDYNRDGQIQQHEVRRVLESYCFPLSHQEFRRCSCRCFCTIIDSSYEFKSVMWRMVGVGTPVTELMMKCKKKKKTFFFVQSELRIQRSYTQIYFIVNDYRLWSHYSPNNSHTISYKEFIQKLGVDCANYRTIAPDSVKLGNV